mgnify:CR=1 FL=1
MKTEEAQARIDELKTIGADRSQRARSYPLEYLNRELYAEQDEADEAEIEQLEAVIEGEATEKVRELDPIDERDLNYRHVVRYTQDS